MGNRVTFGLCICCMLGVAAMPHRAAAAPPAASGYQEKAHPKAFRKNEISLQVMVGAWTSAAFPERRFLDYGQMDLRLGWTLNAPKFGRPIFGGAVQGLLEVTNSAVLTGSGHIISGLSLLLRYNFVRPDAGIVPYIQVGAGVVYNDVYKDENQQAIGQTIEFMPKGAIGAHFFLNDRLSIDVEAGYQHISNAGLSERNGGNDAVGGLAGVTYFF